ncbi:hypothetical protein So717_14910 [Roseobacter cerasinus]|uniref:ABC transporter substrate-binding protein n=1 Tax=Roseobacter cerasinus TaxID=2602289 RepID=A0A640VMN3_9RHOB|nr:hypothetical protein [Roseobacter cerasinus]GFE49738.1 hypothetical protein So717_14910 [Roseobacter cerasinus]
MRVIVVTVSILLASLAGPLLALATAEPVEGEIMLVIGPSASLQPEVIEASGARLVGPQVAPFGALVQPAEATRPDALLHSGAWLVVDGRYLAILCGVPI